MIITWWVKFEGTHPEKWNMTSFDLFLDLIEQMLKEPGLKLEWIIKD